MNKGFVDAVEASGSVQKIDGQLSGHGSICGGVQEKDMGLLLYLFYLACFH